MAGGPHQFEDDGVSRGLSFCVRYDSLQFLVPLAGSENP